MDINAHALQHNIFGPFWVSCEILLLMCWLESCPYLFSVNTQSERVASPLWCSPIHPFSQLSNVTLLSWIPVLLHFMVLAFNLIFCCFSPSCFLPATNSKIPVLYFSVVLSSPPSPPFPFSSFFPSFLISFLPLSLLSLPLFLSSFVHKVSCCPWTDLELLIFLDLPPGSAEVVHCNQEVWFQLCFIIIIIIIIF